MMRNHGIFQFEVHGLWREKMIDENYREYDRTVIATYVAPSPEVAEAHLRRRTKYQSWAVAPTIKLKGSERIDCMLLEQVW